MAVAVPVEWHGVEWGLLLALALVWELIYRMGKAACSRAQHSKVVEEGGSYVAAFVNACVCSVAGSMITLRLLASDETSRAILSSSQVESPSAIFVAAYAFVGYLLMDAVHLFTFYPRLGGVDMCLHHGLFIFVALVDLGYRIFPFPIGWLLLGEVSSLFLNIRWFLIHSGRGDSAALSAVNYLFAATFFIFRVLVMWAGLWHGMAHLRPLVLAPPYDAPPRAVDTICFVVFCGALLNAFWMAKIVRMATRPAPKAGGPLRAKGSPASTPTKGHSELPLAAPASNVALTPSSAQALANAIGIASAERVHDGYGTPTARCPEPSRMCEAV